MDTSPNTVLSARRSNMRCPPKPEKAGEGKLFNSAAKAMKIKIAKLNRNPGSDPNMETAPVALSATEGSLENKPGRKEP